MTKKKVDTDKLPRTQINVIKEKGLPEQPEDRVRRGLPARFHIWEIAANIYCHIWWGREQTSGRRLYLMSKLFTYPTPILKGCGIFEEILAIFKGIAVELYIVGSEKRGPKNQYTDYAQAIKRIESTATSAVISGGLYEGRDFESITALVTSIDFLKKK